MNSFIGWIGGKRALRSEILAAFPDDVGRYIEVFGGAGWVLFGKDPTRQMEVFNDADGSLINIYRCIKSTRRPSRRSLPCCRTPARCSLTAPRKPTAEA